MVLKDKQIKKLIKISYFLSDYTYSLYTNPDYHVQGQAILMELQKEEFDSKSLSKKNYLKKIRLK